jgi:hypothetical protein
MFRSPFPISEHRSDSGFGHPVPPILTHVHQGPAEHELSDSLRGDRQSPGGFRETEKFLQFIFLDDLASDLVTSQIIEKFRGDSLYIELS